jgi:hypothetical protein
MCDTKLISALKNTYHNKKTIVKSPHATLYIIFTGMHIEHKRLIICPQEVAQSAGDHAS